MHTVVWIFLKPGIQRENRRLWSFGPSVRFLRCTMNVCWGVMLKKTNGEQIIYDLTLFNDGSLHILKEPKEWGSEIEGERVGRREGRVGVGIAS